MKILHVRTFEHIPNPDNHPENWPGEIVQVDLGTALPGAEWLEMTLEEYQAYEILVGYNPPPPPEPIYAEESE